ncbi:hypothetical protein MKW94_002077 [Papaver nudicaule]|uniref:TFIIB-type domain-containing protein n=1 Tax=Papaver nudicaule TaxID=74823 RepID=A0AA41S139_PAPNU|nr:hypothetical protein [Papaver nudicaule]
MEETYCSDCKRFTAVISDHSSGDTICLDCGLVLEEYFIDDKSEWRTFSDEPADRDPHRVGEKSNPLLATVGLTTLISIPKGGEYSSSSKSLGRFRHVHVQDPDKGLMDAFKAIGGMSERLGLAETIKDLANELYKKTDDAKSCKGGNKDATIAACLYVACEKLKNPRRIKEFRFVANGLSEKIIGRAIKQIKHISNDLEEESKDEGVSVNAGDFLRRFCSHLGMNNQAVKAAQEAVKKTAELDIRRTPITVAATVIYMITQLSGDPKQIREVSAVTGVAELTIKKSYREIYPYASRLVPAWYANVDALKKLYSRA